MSLSAEDSWVTFEPRVFGFEDFPFGLRELLHHLRRDVLRIDAEATFGDALTQSIHLGDVDSLFRCFSGHVAGSR